MTHPPLFDRAGFTSRAGWLTDGVAPLATVYTPPVVWASEFEGFPAVAWRWGEAARGPQERPAQGALDHFLRLRRRHHPAAIVDFVRRFGPLAVASVGGRSATATQVEPMVVYAVTAQELDDILRVGAATRLHEPIPAAVWPSLGAAINQGEPHECARWVLGQVLRAYVARAGVQLGVQWRVTDTRPRLTLTPELSASVLPTLVCQLILVLADGRDVCRCSGCGVWYVRQMRRPKPGQANYCPECQAQPAVRQRVRRARRGWCDAPDAATDRGDTGVTPGGCTPDGGIGTGRGGSGGA